MDDQIKSKQRVADHGEVFTNEREVKAMCDLVADEVKKIESTVLEPACGEGNFLIEILTRKLKTVRELCEGNTDKYELYSVKAVSSLYGVDILGDNVVICRQNLFDLWQDEYVQNIGKNPDEKLQQTVLHILEVNIVRGNTLSTKLVDENTNDTDEPIVFSEWIFDDNGFVIREENRFDAMLESEETSPQLDLFGLLQNSYDKWKKDPMTGKYLPIVHDRIYFKEVGNG